MICKIHEFSKLLYFYFDCVGDYITEPLLYTRFTLCALIYTFCRNAIGTYLNDKMRYTCGTAVLHVALLKTTHRKSKQTKCEGT